MDPARGSLDGFLDYDLRVGGLDITLGGVVAAIATIVVVWLLSIVISRAFHRYAAQREARTRAAIYTLSRLAKYALWFVGGLAALGFLGIPTSRFAVLAGALGVGLGFGLQAIFSNFVSGIIMLFERSLRVGDVVELDSGLHGEVRDINIRATLITTNDNIDILVPNSEFVTGRVVNWTHGDVTRHGDISRRLHIPFSVAYGTDKELAKKAALEAAAEVPFTLAQEGPRRPQVWLVKFGATTLDFELVVWLTPEASKRPGAVKAGYLWALDSALCAHGIEVQNPQLDVHMRTLFDLQAEEVRALIASRAAATPAERRDLTRREPPPIEEKPQEILDELPEHEREKLASNDACEEVERGAREDEERRVAEEEAAAAADETAVEVEEPVAPGR